MGNISRVLLNLTKTLMFVISKTPPHCQCSRGQHSSQQTHQSWYLVKNKSWTDVNLSTLFQRWQNNVETTLIELRWFNIDEPMLFHRWNLIENESWDDVCLPTLFQRWQNNVETALIELHWFNVGDPMLFQRWY